MEEYHQSKRFLQEQHEKNIKTTAIKETRKKKSGKLFQFILDYIQYNKVAEPKYNSINKWLKANNRHHFRTDLTYEEVKHLTDILEVQKFLSDRSIVLQQLSNGRVASTKRFREDRTTRERAVNRKQDGITGKQQLMFHEGHLPTFSFCHMPENNRTDIFIPSLGLYEEHNENLMEIIDKPEEEGKPRKIQRVDIQTKKRTDIASSFHLDNILARIDEIKEIIKQSHTLVIDTMQTQKISGRNTMKLQLDELLETKGRRGKPRSTTMIKVVNGEKVVVEVEKYPRRFELKQLDMPTKDSPAYLDHLKNQNMNMLKNLNLVDIELDQKFTARMLQDLNDKYGNLYRYDDNDEEFLSNIATIPKPVDVAPSAVILSPCKSLIEMVRDEIESKFLPIDEFIKKNKNVKDFNITL